MKGIVVFDTMLNSVSSSNLIPAVIYALENGDLLVRTDQEHNHLLSNIEDHLQKEGWIEYWQDPIRHPFLQRPSPI